MKNENKQLKRREPLLGVGNNQSLASYPIFMQHILQARGIQKKSDLDAQLKHLSDPFELLGMQIAVPRLLQALRQQQRILIVGDFDADGATSTALLMRGFAALGFQCISYLLPDRFIFGYGLSREIVDEISRSYPLPHLLITVDNGISSIEGVERANALGIDVIITDHHLPGDQIPDALAIVNPNQRGCSFEHKNLAGVGVAFHVLMALRQRCRIEGDFQRLNIQEPNLANFLDLVAIGTVADVVKLDAYNRIFVVQGLARMRAGLAGEGVKALLAVAQKPLAFLTSQDIGFAIGPRINAAGRLDDMRLGVELLLETNAAVALEMAQELDGLNQNRKSIQKQMQLEAEIIVTQLCESFSQVPRIICVYHELWHQGVVGLIASQLKERFHRPVFAFAPVFNEQGEIVELKGSGRSIDGIHLRDLLDLIAKSNPACLDKFGGHAMAAGLTIQPSSLEVFETDALTAMQVYDAGVFEPLIWVDDELSPENISLDNALLLENLLPWGQGLPLPVFEGDFYLVSLRILGGQHVKSQLNIVGQDTPIDAICFNADIDRWQAVQNSASKMVRAVYGLSVNRFRGQESVQLLIDFIE